MTPPLHIRSDSRDRRDVEAAIFLMVPRGNFYGGLLRLSKEKRYSHIASIRIKKSGYPT